MRVNVSRIAALSAVAPARVVHSNPVTDGCRPSQLRYGQNNVPLAIAHRGGAGIAAENTVAAFRRAYDLGFRYLETDVRVTSDGVLVAFHDARLARVTGRRGWVSRTTSAQLARLTVGGHPIPTLDQLLSRFPDACFAIDVKDPRCIAPLAEVLRTHGVAGRVCVAGTWDGQLRALTERVGVELTTALGWRDLCALVTSAHARINAPRQLAGTFAHVPLSIGRLPVFGECLVARAAELGIGVIVWTVDEPAQMHRLLDAGVAGVITDRPDLLREVLVARDQWAAPVPRPDVDAQIAL
jgi:glycerophosphoryl diester phosphodiesterase